MQLIIKKFEDMAEATSGVPGEPLDELLHKIVKDIDHSKDLHGCSRPKSNVVCDSMQCSLMKKGSDKDTFESFIETCDNASFNKAITDLIDHILKTCCEILCPLPASSAEWDKTSMQQNSIERLKCTHPFSCPICDFVLSEPVTLLCGHTYCKKCLVKWKPNACKVCKKRIYGYEIDGAKVNVIVSGLVSRWWQPELNAEDIRLQGNQSMSSQDYAKALRFYNDALKQAPHDHITLSNRSLVLNKQSRNAEALRDAETAVQMQPCWAKGYFRQAAALKAMGRLEDALVAYVLWAALEPTAALAELHALLKRLLRRRQPAEGHVIKRRSRKLESDELQHHSDDSNSNCSTDVPTTRPELTTRVCLTADQKLQRIVDRCHSAAVALRARHGEQFVRTVDGEAGREDFECSLCYRLLWQPASTPCGHTFCRPCIDRWLDHSPTCPLCKMALDEFLADRGRATTTFLQHAMETVLPAATAERRRTHDAELLADSLAGQDRHHEIPIFVCTLAFPSLPCPLHVFEPRYRLMVRRCMESGTREFGICLSSGTSTGGFVDIGVMLEIRDLRYFPDGRCVVDTIGSRRFRCLEKGQRDGYSTARVEFLSDQTVPPEGMQELQTLHDRVRGLVERWWTEHFRNQAEKRDRVITFFGDMPAVETNYWTLPAGPSWLWWTLAILPVSSPLQLEILSITSLKRRLRVIGSVLSRLAPPEADPAAQPVRRA